jgi:hypothetical protein
MKTKTTRESRLISGGIPRYIRCYDNGGMSDPKGSADRYTVCFTGRAGVCRAPDRAPEYSYRAMSAEPYHPQGIGLWCGTNGQPADTMGEIRGKWYWPPAIGRKCHLGRRIAFADLPEACRRLVMADYREIWGMNKGRVAA